MHNVLALAIISSILMLCYLGYSCYLAHKRARRLNQICKGLYKEYEKMQNPQWAEETLKDIIRRVVSRVDNVVYKAS